MLSTEPWTGLDWAAKGRWLKGPAAAQYLPKPRFLNGMAAAPPPCTVCLVPQEVEKQYREGTLKAHIVAVLKAVQPEALTTQGAMRDLPLPRCSA